jgi:lipoate-protein ligase B
MEATPASSSALRVEWLGTVPYGAALERQREAVEERRRGGPDRLLLLEHPPVITLGRSAKPENLRASRAELARRGVPVLEVARGGDVTWHGPGQLVGYAIADLAARGEPDVHAWLRRVEGALIEALGAFGVGARRIPGRTGVFLEKPDATGSGRRDRRRGAAPPDAGSVAGRAQKIASIGVGLRGWITWHGFALNVTTSCDAFADVVPCGLHDVRMTSLAEALGVEPGPDLFTRARDAVATAFVRSLA